MATIENPAIPKGSTVLITGVNGFLASHAADQFVQQGYKVRGTVRDVEKNAWLAAYFDKTYGEGNFELAAVPDMTAKDAYAEAIKGVSAFIHVASVLSFDADPEKVIPTAVESALVAIKAAYEEPSVKRFVQTSSSSTAVPVELDLLLKSKDAVVTEESWSPDAVEVAYRPGPWGPEHGAPVYAASKIKQEQAVWKYYEENKSRRPDIVVNSVLPNMNFGKSLDVVNQGHPSSSGLFVFLMKGARTPAMLDVPMYYVDVQDTGLLHVAGAVLPDVEGERIFGFAEPYNWNKVLGILRKQNPDRKFHDDYHSDEYPLFIKPRDRAEELLRRFGRPGWTPMEESIANNTADLKDDEAAASVKTAAAFENLQ
ncbi:aldehyde reductase II [Colletotrichum sojae]|uniref:Aldehyde reductase II n=1 Tax=Colletotrichum sojae TaxID=2175907 RepID=A0A8H6J789_9PEZI|nr:aldehyde reductase II [Colletotrichum sojae]